MVKQSCEVLGALSILHHNIYHLCFWAVIPHIPPSWSQHKKKHLKLEYYSVCMWLFYDVYVCMYVCTLHVCQSEFTVDTPSLS